MTIEMILFAASGEDKARTAEQRLRLSFATIEELRVARRLSHRFAILPKNTKLLRVAMEFSATDKMEWSVAQWAGLAGMSERTFSRQVLKETGMSFRKWRLQHLLLASTSELARGLSIEEIAYRAGYKTTSSFISTFKKVFGLTPGEYRKTLALGTQAE